MAPPKNTPPSSPPAVDADETAAGKLCAICQTAVVRGHTVILCPDCGLPFHAECWGENTGCGTYGCPHAPETVKAQGTVEATAWGDEKLCPSCGRKIKASAIVCRFCRTRFQSREAISRDEFENREYEDQELIKPRNFSILIFILSAVPCLCPIMLGVTVAWIWSDPFPVKMKRLPPALKMLARASCGLSALWIVLCVITFLASIASGAV